MEQCKIRLASQHDFNLMDAFQMIDLHEKGWVSVPELREALEDLGFFPKKDDVFLFVRRYDKDNDGRILFSDFCEAFSPKDALSQSALSRRPAKFRHTNMAHDQYFSKSSYDLFLRALRTHLSVEESSELLRKRFSRSAFFNAHDAFAAIDVEKHGFLVKEDFRRFLAEN